MFDYEKCFIDGSVSLDMIIESYYPTMELSSLTYTKAGNKRWDQAAHLYNSGEDKMEKAKGGLGMSGSHGDAAHRMYYDGSRDMEKSDRFYEKGKRLFTAGRAARRAGR